MAKKVCIMGTAPSWRMTPWADATWDIWGLNDAYQLRPRRWTRWYELHPLDQMFFVEPGAAVQAGAIPKGHYIRPAGHIEWLKAQAAGLPVFLQAEPPSDWPAQAHRFPIESIDASFGGDYWASGPAYMLAQADLEGYDEIMVTGIHLATEAEYRKQRPQWEFLIGRVLGRTITRDDQAGFRVYRGQGRSIWLPETCPILKHEWRYAYEHEPEPPASLYRAELKQVVKDKNALMERLIVWPAGQPKDAELETLRRLSIIEEDCREQMQKEAQAREFAPIHAVLGG